MTKDQLDDALYRVKGFTPMIVVGPGHPIATFDGWNDPHPEHYRGARVVVHEGWDERCEIINITDFERLVV